VTTGFRGYGVRRVEGATKESAREEGESTETGSPMLDPSWTHEKGYAHALALINRLEHFEAGAG
jgi:hypothetical protein